MYEVRRTVTEIPSVLNKSQLLLMLKGVPSYRNQSVMDTSKTQHIQLGSGTRLSNRAPTQLFKACDTAQTA